MQTETAGREENPRREIQGSRGNVMRVRLDENLNYASLYWIDASVFGNDGI